MTTWTQPEDGSSPGELRFEGCGDEVGLAHTLHFEGLVAFKDGNNSFAEACLRDALTRWQARGFRWEQAQCIPGHLADVARAAGNLSDAMGLYQECLVLNWDQHYLEDVSWSLARLAIVTATDGQVDQAVRLMCLADWVEELLGATLSPHIRRLHGLAVGIVEDRADVRRFAEIRASVSSADFTAEIAAALALTRHETAHQAHASAGLGRRSASATC